MSRLFFALWPDDKTRTQLAAIAEQFRDEKIKPVKNSNLHITLEFLGEVSDQDRDELVAKINKLQHNAFELKLTQVGWWHKPQVLWISTKQIPTELLLLVKSIRKCVKKQGLKTDKREYHPHVTIARKVKRINIPNKAYDIDWSVDKFVLVVSKPAPDGVVYEVLQQWPLN